MSSTVTFSVRIAAQTASEFQVYALLSSIDAWSMNWRSTLKTNYFGLYDFYQHFTGTLFKTKMYCWVQKRPWPYRTNRLRRPCAIVLNKLSAHQFQPFIFVIARRNVGTVHLKPGYIKHRVRSVNLNKHIFPTTVIYSSIQPDCWGSRSIPIPHACLVAQTLSTQRGASSF